MVIFDVDCSVCEQTRAEAEAAEEADADEGVGVEVEVGGCSFC